MLDRVEDFHLDLDFCHDSRQRILKNLGLPLSLLQWKIDMKGIKITIDRILGSLAWETFPMNYAHVLLSDYLPYIVSKGYKLILQ